MPCFHPLDAYRKPGQRPTIGRPTLAQRTEETQILTLPCGECLGCTMAYAKSWALRCNLEMQRHHKTAFTTLTYSDDNKPPTLDRPSLQRWLKRLRGRSATAGAPKLRFFACGEYGEHTKRPHYHAILFGLSSTDKNLIEDTWALGHTRTYDATPETIAYTAGYTAKKWGWFDDHISDERVDPDTGEVYQYQPPFTQMSRRPGIAAHARQWAQSWRLYAIQNGQKMAVPRFLHEAWKKTATEQQLEELLIEKQQYALNRDTQFQRLQAAEKIAQARQAQTARSRKY